MKKILLCSLLISFFLVGNAIATSLPWTMDVINSFEDNNAEEWVDVNSNDVLDEGDILKGVFDWHQISGPTPYSMENLGPELSGIFEIEVTEKSDSAVSTLLLDLDADGINEAYDQYSYTFGPTASFEATYGNDAVAAFYIDDTPDLEVWEDLIKAQAYADATDGSLYWVFGLLDGGSWYIEAAPEDVNIYSLLNFQDSLGVTTIGLDWIQISIAGPQIGPPLVTFSKSGINLAGVYSYTDIELWAEIVLEGKKGNNTEFDLFSQIQADIKPTPEPATMLMLGSGLIGLAALGRKKFFKKQ